MTKIFTLVTPVAQIMFMKPDTCQLCGKVMWDNMGYHCAADFIPWELFSFVRRALNDTVVSCFTACETMHVMGTPILRTPI